MVAACNFNTALSALAWLQATRPRVGAAFQFALGAESLPLIAAAGSGATFGYHHARTAATLSLAQPGARVCVCRDASSNEGTINGA